MLGLGRDAIAAIAKPPNRKAPRLPEESKSFLARSLKPVSAARAAGAWYSFRMAEQGTAGGSERTEPLRSSRDDQTKPPYWREVFDTMQAGVLLCDVPCGKIVDVNEGACALFGYDRSQMLTLSLWALSGLPAEQAPQSVSSQMERALAAGKGLFEWCSQRADGSRVWCEVEMLRVGAAGTRRIVVIIRDIGELKTALEASRLAEERYRALVRNLPKSAIIMCDHDLRLVVLDGPEISAGGIPKEAMLGRTIYESLPPDFVKAIEGNMRRVLAGESFSAELPFGDLWYTYNYVPIRDDAGRVLYGMILAVNITERRRAEEALRKSEEQFVRIFQSSPDAVALTRASDGLVLEVNPAFKDVLGWSRAEAVGKTAIELSMWPDAENRAAALQELVKNGSPEYAERSVKHKDGRLIEGLLSVRPIEVENQACYLCTFRDISERKKAELEREHLIAQLTARNAEMEQFTYTVSHDLKAPLVTISGFLGMLERDLETGSTERVRADMDRIASATSKMMKLLSDLLELSRVGRVTKPFTKISLSEVVRDALELLSGAIAERKARLVVAPDLPEVSGDRVRLVQVIQNLVENALRHMGDQTEPVVEIGARPDLQWIVCYVRDNGIGIDPRYAERIFGLVEKLDPRSEGTGVGLALVRRIIESHGGSISVESNGRRGSTFVFRLPRGNTASRTQADEGEIQWAR